MKRLGSFLLLFLLGLSLNCKTQHSAPSGEPVSSRALVPSAAESMSSSVNPIVNYDNFLIGALVLSQLMAVAPQFIYGGNADFANHYDYQVCPSGSSSCNAGKFLWGAKIFPNLSPGGYSATISPCGAPTVSGEVCGAESPLSFTQQENPSSDLLSLIQEELQITQDIKAQASTIQSAYEEYKSAVYPQGPAPTDPLSQSVDTQLNYGVDLTAELINSSTYVSYFTQIYGSGGSAEAVDNSASSSTDATATGDQQQQIAAMQAQLASLAQKIASGQSSSGIGAGGSLLITLGTVSVIAGVIIASVSWYVPYYLKSEKLNNLINGQIDEFDVLLKKEITDFVNENGPKTTAAFNAKIDSFLDANIPTALASLKKTMNDNIQNAKPDELIDTAFGMAREAVHDPLNFNVYVNHAFLERSFGGKAKFEDRFSSKTVTDEKGTVYTERSVTTTTPLPVEDQFRYYRDANGLIYQRGMNIREFAFSPAYPSISQYTYDTLTSLEKKDFAVDLGGTIKLVPARQGTYVQIGAKYFQVLAPLKMPVIPELSQDTINNLQANRNRLLKMGDPKIKVDDVFGMGVPLYDKYGRLVEPPEDWKVPGRNWISGKRSPGISVNEDIKDHNSIPDYTVGYDYNLRPAVKGQVLQNIPTKLNFTAAQLKTDPNRFYTISDYEPGVVSGVIDKIDLISWKIDLKMQLALQGVKDNVKKYNVVLNQKIDQQSKTLPVEVELRLKQKVLIQVNDLLTDATGGKTPVTLTDLTNMSESEKKAELAQLNERIGQKMDQLTDAYRKRFVKGVDQGTNALKEKVVNPGIAKLTEKVEPVATVGKVVGSLLAVAGVGAITGVFVQQALGLTEGPSQTLQTSLTAIEVNLANLHAKRLQVLQQINAWLSSNGFTPPDSEWVYHL